MTNDNGPTVIDSRAGEIARYVEEVQEALRDLPAEERDELLEDLPAHLSEVADEDPTPLRDRLGEPATYAAELRAALDLAATSSRRRRTARWSGWWKGLGQRLGRLDQRVGPIFGYQRISELGRLLVPAWWVLRGYLAAMLVVAILDDRVPAAGELGLLPRLGGSTLAGWVILAGFGAGSVGLARRGPRLSRWPRLAALAVSVYLLFFGAMTLADLDEHRWDAVTGDAGSRSGDLYDVPVDSDGRRLLDVTLIDQDDNPIDIGWDYCGAEFERVPGEAVPYPRCPEGGR